MITLFIHNTHTTNTTIYRQCGDQSKIGMHLLISDSIVQPLFVSGDFNGIELRIRKKEEEEDQLSIQKCT
jgi:hypothetical protein